MANDLASEGAFPPTEVAEWFVLRLGGQYRAVRPRLHPSFKVLHINPFDLGYGFCKARTVSTVEALSAMLSCTELVATALYNLANSVIKLFPTEPKGILK